jgi:hypothetical protein
MDRTKYDLGFAPLLTLGADIVFVFCFARMP